jgi:organic hydroperoxide reductase OsmC/OhrA
MSEHCVRVAWERGSRDFGYETYSRDHVWSFPGGTRVSASAAPDYLGSAEHVDPEEAFVASLSSCHMLTFLAIAARRRLVVDRYEDDAVGVLEKNADGRLAVTRVVLRPRIVFSGDKLPDAAELARLHERAHATCFIANSVTTDVRVEPPLD